MDQSTKDQPIRPRTRLVLQLLEYAEHVREEFIDKYYMNPEEIRMTLAKMDTSKGKNLKTE
jgi:hypothetical protein